MSALALAAVVDDLRATQPDRRLVVPRLVAGLPLLMISAMHMLSPELRMDPLVEAAGLPAASLLAPLAVAIEFVAALSLLLGVFARVGAFLAIPTMAVAVYAHVVIDTWPNGSSNEPPLALPVLVMAAAALVLWKGAGRWSFDARRPASGRPHWQL